MFVCMFYLSPRSRIIVSIWETSEKQLLAKKREKERRRTRSRSLVSSLQTIAHIVQFDVFFENFCYFIFCFYILYDGRRVALILLRLIFHKLLFLFFFFPFFFVNSLQRNTWRFAPPRFVCLFFASRGFRLEFRLNFSNFRAKVSRLLLALP